MALNNLGSVHAGKHAVTNLVDFFLVLLLDLVHLHVLDDGLDFLIKLRVKVFVSNSSLVNHLLKTSLLDTLEGKIVQLGDHNVGQSVEVWVGSKHSDNMRSSFLACVDALHQFLLLKSVLDAHELLDLGVEVPVDHLELLKSCSLFLFADVSLLDGLDQLEDFLVDTLELSFLLKGFWNIIIQEYIKDSLNLEITSYLESNGEILLEKITLSCHEGGSVGDLGELEVIFISIVLLLLLNIGSNLLERRCGTFNNEKILLVGFGNCHTEALAKSITHFLIERLGINVKIDEVTHLGACLSQKVQQVGIVIFRKTQTVNSGLHVIVLLLCCEKVLQSFLLLLELSSILIILTVSQENDLDISSITELFHLFLQVVEADNEVCRVSNSLRFNHLKILHVVLVLSWGKFVIVEYQVSVIEDVVIWVLTKDGFSH